MLKVNNIDVYYGAIHAIKDVSLEVPDGEIVTLIGSNGAGKSTTLHTISGLIKPKNGSIIFEDKDIAGMPAHKIVGMGLCQVPEGRHVFANMTVMENLELGAYLRSDKAGIEEDMKKIFDKFPRLLERKNQISGTLSGGEQQMLAMGRALMSRPRLLLLDEPSMGLAPLLVKEIFNIIKEINESGTTVLLLKVRDVMTKNVITVHYDAGVEDAAYLLYKNKINALPVVDDDNKLCGIITDSDIFRAFVDIMGLARTSTRITIDVTDKVGVIADIGAMFRDNNINIISIVAKPETSVKTELTIRAELGGKGLEIIEQLREAGYYVTDISNVKSRE